MKRELFEYYNHLGFMNPFYMEKNDQLIVDNSFENLIKQKNQPNIIDPVCILELLNTSQTFGDRTMVQDISLTPWMAKPNQDFTSWEYVKNLPKHGHIKASEEEVSNELFSRLRNEVKEYIGNKSNIGILLSGGMDSRIIAVVIKHLQDAAEINVSVIALTWGIEKSRDVVYAEKISELFGWDWKYFELSHENLIENIGVAAKNGALYSPIHLHALPKIRELKNIDCIIAGSFGDSVGRAEYSGVKVKNLTSSASRMMNKFKMIKNSVYKEYIGKVNDDLEKYHKLFPRQDSYQHYELEKQIHYMRKQLNQCMSVVNQKIPLYQAFTSPDVFGYMWSLSPEIRTDKIYYHILKKYSNELMEIPWARTGCRYLLDNCENPDSYLKNYHNYGKWIREDISSIIKNKVLSSHIESLGLFNMEALQKLLWLNSYSNNKMLMIDEYLIWIASLSDLIQNYNIKGLDVNNNSMVDKLDSNVISVLHYIIHKMKNS